MTILSWGTTTSLKSCGVGSADKEAMTNDLKVMLLHDCAHFCVWFHYGSFQGEYPAVTLWSKCITVTREMYCEALDHNTLQTGVKWCH